MKSIVARIARIPLFLAFCAALMNPAHAGPANPEPFQIAQPDGTVVQAVMRGDEFQGWTETTDGYTIVKNPASGFYEYAIQGAGGELIPSGIIASAASVKSQMAAQGLLPPMGLRPPRNIELEQAQGELLNAVRTGRTPAFPDAYSAVTGIWVPTPVSGAKKMLAILVNFQNATLTAGAATYWSNAVFNTGASSVAKYYQDNSFGNLSVSAVTHTQPGSPAGVVTVSLAQNHPNCGGNCPYATEAAWINSALAAAAPYVNFTLLDTNGNGTITVDEAVVYFIVAGYEASAGILTPSIWAHAWGGTGVSAGGKALNAWALNGDKYNTTTQMRMGIIAHEMGHAMAGLPDVYDISGYNEGLGIFSLMAGGNWGRQNGEINGTTPVNLDAWSRQYLGWSNPQLPANGAGVTFVSPLSSPTAPVMLINNSISTSEYWLVENRPPVGWDAGMFPFMGTWTGGLLIQHIDLNIGSKAQNSFNKYVAGSHQGNMAEEPSTATCSLVAQKLTSVPKTSSRGCPSILYYSGNSTTFNGGSTPNSNYYSGTASSLGLTNISAPGTTMTATAQTGVIVNGPPSAPAIGTATSGNGSVYVAFTPGSLNGGTLVNHNVNCTPWASGSGASSPITVSGLVNGTSYICYVRTQTNLGYSAWSAPSNAVVPAVGDNFPPGSIPSGWVQPAGSNAAWFVTTDAAYSGGLSLKSGVITHGQRSDIAYTASFSAGNVSFARKVSSESGFDFFRFYIDGVLQSSASASGEMTWSVLSFPLTAGTHTLQWSYIKDNSISTNSDAAWIDSVSLPPGAPSAPVIGTATAGAGQLSVAFTPGNLNGGTLVNHIVNCTPGGVGTATSSPITVSGLTGGTSYRCWVRTQTNLGYSPWSAASNAVTPTSAVGPPSAPVIGTATAGAGQLSIAFTPGNLNGGTLVNHIVNCTPNGTGTAASSPITVSGLTGGTSYRCWVRTQTNLGYSPWSAASNAVTPTALVGPPSAPVIGTATAGAGQLSVAFTPGNLNGGTLVNHIVNCTPGGVGTATSSPITVSSLTGGTSYRCWVRTQTNLGYSPWSAASNAVTPTAAAGLPSAPVIGTATAGAGQISVAFTPGALNGGRLVNHIVNCSPGGAASAAGSPITVSGLTAGTYTCWVRTQTNVGYSPWSAASNAVTPTGGLPSAPVIGTATAGAGQLSVAFTPGNLNGGTLVNHIVNCAPGGVGTATSSPITVGGLTAGTSYTCWVRTQTNAGYSPWSAASNAVTPTGALPSAPVMGTATAGNGSLSVAFTPGNLNGGTLVNHIVNCTPGGAVSATSSPITVSGLANGTSYTCWVRTQTNAGYGPWSAASNAVTPTATGSLPSAPVIGTATAGNGSVSVSFTPGALNGGTLVNHIVNCSPAGVASATSSPITVSGLANGTSYTCWVRTRTSVGYGPWSAASSIVTPTAADTFPPGGAVPAGWVQGSSHAAWVVSSVSPYSGSLSLKSGAIADSQWSDISYAANFSAGTVSFARRVSSEANYDFFDFYIDGVLQSSASGEVAWSVLSFPLSAGIHTLMWRYIKDINTFSGSDAAWIDSVILPPNSPT